MTAILQAHDLRWSVRGRTIIRDVSMSTHAGETVGVLGPNGSGKSTLIRLLAGLRPCESGQVLLEGRPIGRLSKRALARKVAVVEQEASSSLELGVEDVIGLGRIPHRPAWAPATTADRERVAWAAGQTDVLECLDRSYSTLSGGERQRVQIARALAQEPTVLLLDEPTNHLDIRHQLELLSLVRSTPVTSVVALHDLNLAATYCDRVFVLAGGRVVAGGPPSTVLTAELIADVYGVRARVEPLEHGVSIRVIEPL
ncbi:ABC transporter ATP-binding protein [Aeromicrobium chenweiae]|uniref:Histidinol phosphatase n=1 Tax=Aeromicrobium chenweiae TaxID=2079793 RepID=A0A2S0WLV6_9ACTN|nr:ABC transporter ATP-binding protein [Aeromicrobium chenweiae]AWB92306.1 histidinol phosphatase [Aeromicrobium chenweiae]TGN31408.1 ABC transporter ATP-binding protein [Aeromicrobium chenweiae]